jgi:NAD(P)-dependent dehydrogenase (short-subunit alcohol dehydrogenase family)
MPLFNGKIALVTGGGSGIGRATAVQLAEKGANVILAGRTQDKLLQVQADIQKRGGTASTCQVDVTSKQQVEEMVEKIIGQYGRLDLTCHAAGIGGPLRPIADITAEAFRQVIAINLIGLWLCMKYELRQMKWQSADAIVNIASINGEGGTPTAAGLCGQQSGCHQPDQDGRSGVCTVAYPSECRLPGAGSNADAGRDVSYDRGNGGSVCGEDSVKSVGLHRRYCPRSGLVMFGRSEFITGHALTVDGGSSAIK